MPKKNNYTLKESSLNYIFSISAMLILSFILFYIITSVMNSTGKTYEEVCSQSWVAYLNIIFSALSFFIVFFAFNLITKKNFVKASRLEFRFNYKIFLLIVFLAILSVFACVNATNLFNYFAGVLTSTPVSNSLGVNLKSFGDFCLITLLYAILPSVGEELVFRGIIYNGLREKFSAKTSIIISAVLFALVHFSIFKTFYQLILGLILGLIVYFTGSIVYCMIFHLINNFVVLLVSYISQGVSIFEFAFFGVLEIILSVVILVVGIIIAFFIFKLIRKIALKHKNYYRLESTSEPLYNYFNQELVQGDKKIDKNNLDKNENDGKFLLIVSIAIAVLLWLTMSLGG